MIIQSAKANDDFTIEVVLSNQHKIIYDMKTRLEGTRFFSLKEGENFKKMQLKNGKLLEWNEFQQISLDEILMEIEK